MPTYQLTSPKTGQRYRVQAGGELSPQDAEAAVNHYDSVYEQNTANKSFAGIGDTLSGIGSMLGGLPTTVPAAYYGVTEGFSRPDQYSPEARAAFDANAAYQQRMQQESQNRLMRGEATSAGDAFREAGPSLGFTVGSMAGAIPAGMAAGALAGTFIEPGGGTVGGGLIGAAASGIGAAVGAGTVAYRMAGQQFLNDAFNALREQRGGQMSEEEMQQAYNELLPLAENSALWEAGPEAIGNAASLGAAKIVFGLGKPLITNLAKTALGKAGVKVGAIAGSQAVELGTETATALGQGVTQAQADAYARGDANWQQARSPYDRPGGTLQAFKDIAPATLALGATTLGAGGVVKLATLPFQNRTNPNDPTSPNQTPAPTDDTGELTAEDVEDLETLRLGDLETQTLPTPGAGAIRPQPGASRVTEEGSIPSTAPQRTARFQESSINEEPIMEGDALTDLRIPRSPEAIAESQRIEAERQQKIATMRMLDARAQGMPLIPDSPSGSRDILDFANENPIYLPPGFSEQRNLPEYEKLKEAKLPPYWRQFVASSKRGGNPSDVAQRAFDAGFIDAPTADAYLEAVRGGIEGRQQYRVQFAQRDKALQQEEERVVNFEQSQNKLARKRSTERVDFEDIRKGDAMTIDGEPAVVRNIEYDQDGYLTNVVIEDGKRFGLMQFDPQTRGGILVDEFQPRQKVPGSKSQVPSSGQLETSNLKPETSPQGFTNLNPGARTGGFLNAEILAEGAALLQQGFTTFANWSKAMLSRFGQGIRDALTAIWQQITSPQTNAAQNVRMGRAQGSAPVTMGQGGFVNGPGALNFTSRLGDQLQQASQQAARPAATAAPLKAAKPPELGERWWATTTRAEARSVLEPASLEELKAIAVRMDTNPNQPKAKLIDRLVQITGVYADAVGIRGADAVGPRGAMPDYTGQAEAAQQLMREQRAARAQQPKERGLPKKAKPRTPEEFARDMAALMARPATGGKPINLSAATAAPLKAAYASALRGSSTAMIPLAEVFAAAQAANPTLTQEQFQAQVMVDYEAGSLMLEGAGSPQEAAQAGMVLPGTPVGTAVRMMVTEVPGSKSQVPSSPPLETSNLKPETSPQGFTNLNPGARTGGFLNAEILAEGAALLQQGFTTFANWSKAMLSRFGQGIRDALTAIWQQITSPQTNAAQNVRMGRAQGSAPVTLGQGGFVNGPAAPNETQSRFASPNPADRTINGPRTDELVTAEANAWLNSLDQQAAIEAFVAGQVPLSLDTAERAAATLIANLSEQAATAKTEVARMWAHVQGRRMARVWTTEHLSADPARALRQRGVVNNTILAPIAPVLAAQELLEDRAKKVIDNRFDGGTEGAVEKVKDVVKKADEQAGTDLAEQLEDTTSTATDPRIADLEARLKVLREQIQNREAEADTTLKETSSTWQKILNVLNSASQRKSKLLNGVKGRVASMRKAALERKAARRAEGRLSANPIEDFADDVIIGTSLLAEGIVEFSNWSQALVREIGARSAADLRKLYAEASKEYLSLLEAEKARPATSLQSKHPNLKKMLDALRKKMFPGMTWADIFTQLPETQKARQREIYRRLMLDERLRNLTPEERLALTNELDKAWLRERRKVFMRELEKAGVLGETKPKDREKVKAAAPRLLRLMNLGMLNSEMFREALAKEYGLNMIDAAAAADLRALGERIQKAPEGLPRRKLEQQLVERLQKLSGYTLFQVMDSWWTASVLSGWRTQVDIGLSIANGIEDIGLGSIVAALRSGNKDVAVRGLSALFGRIPSAFMEAVDHVATGNKAMMRSFELEVKQAMEGGNLLASDVGRQMWDRGGWRKVPGGFMVFYGRLMTALDHVNSSSTREGAKALALARHPDLYQKALRISDADRAAARQQARLELTGGAVPATQQERIEEAARVREILEQGIPAEVLAEATEVGRAAALQGEPTGLGGALLDAVLSAVSVVNRKAQQLAARDNPDRLTRQGAAITAAMVPMARAITGTKFARTVAHALNRTTSYVPGVGLYTVGQQGRTGAFGDILAARQVIGTLVGLALYLAFDDDDDEKGIEDSWKDKTPQQKAQLYAQGKQPFTVWTRDDRGRVRNWNYQQWGIAGIVNTVAAMLKQKDSEDGTLNVLMSSLTQGAMSFTDKAQLQGLQTVFGENYRSTDPASGIAASLNKWAAQTVGGVVPRLVKDIDMVASPELRSTTEWWQKWAKEVPMLRQLSSGKRIDILGQDINLVRGPLSRVTQLGTADPVYRLLGKLNARDVWLSDPSQGVRVVKLADGTRRNMNPTEKDRYQRLTGAAYRAYLEKEGPALMQMSPEDAQEAVSKATARLRATAAYQATH